MSVPRLSPPAMRRARRVAAVTSGKLALLATRSLGRGGGTAIPGVVAERVDPTIAQDLAIQIPQGVIAVSGTNGKTTTCRMLARILSDAGYAPLRNDSGSNLMRGVASALVQRSDLFGRIAQGDRAIGLFEVDEAALPGVLEAVHPGTVLLIDLFRDQLDRYGEVATVARLWSEALARAGARGQVVVNADDPLLVNATSASTAPRLFFGVRTEAVGTSREHASDVKACPRCGGPITYERVTLGHLGEYSCSHCGFSRPPASVEASAVELHGIDGTGFQLRHDDISVPVHLPLPGLYNVYNAVAAAAVAVSLGISLHDAAQSLNRVTPAFGRMERIEIEGRHVILALAKNPAGLNEVLRAARGPSDLHLMMMLNDNTADGHDVSWIWDADVELLDGGIGAVVFSGTRAADMALRFKYADLLPVHDGHWRVEYDTAVAFKQALEWTPPGETLFIIPTYTALLELRDLLAKRGYVKQYWEH